MRRLAVALCIATTTSCATARGSGAAGVAVDVGTFHRALDPYGEWIVVGDLGEVWRPTAVAPDWGPFYFGHWVWSDDGWLWVSDDPWGSLPYHYGRWTLAPAVGWVWVPGFDWAPAWVTWRFGASYVGWAPLGPRASLRVTSTWLPPERWVFVPTAQFVGVTVNRVAVPRVEVAAIAARVAPAPPPRGGVGGGAAAPWGGPARHLVEEARGRPVPVQRLVHVPEPRNAGRERGGTVEIFRPGGSPRPPEHEEERAFAGRFARSGAGRERR